MVLKRSNQAAQQNQQASSSTGPSFIQNRRTATGQVAGATAAAAAAPLSSSTVPYLGEAAKHQPPLQVRPGVPVNDAVFKPNGATAGAGATSQGFPAIPASYPAQSSAVGGARKAENSQTTLPSLQRDVLGKDARDSSNEIARGI